MIAEFKNQLAITIQNTIALLGFMPNESGSFVKEVLKSTEPKEYIAMGLCLEDCQKVGSYEPLDKYVALRLEKDADKSSKISSERG